MSDISFSECRQFKRDTIKAVSASALSTTVSSGNLHWWQLDTLNVFICTSLEGEITGYWKKSKM